MAFVTCRAPSCGMQLANKYMQKQHEGLMHKTLIDETIEKIISKIMKTNPAIDLSKKVVYNGESKVSYQEISEMKRDSKEFLEIKPIFVKIIEDWCENNEDKNIGDFLRIVKFYVSGK